MTKQKKLTLVNWSSAAILVLLFLLWHGAFEGPLTEDKVEYYLERFREKNPDADTAYLRQFLEEDDGKAVVMVNAIKLYETPIEVNGQRFGDSSDEALNEYTSFVLPYLLRRGSYPLYSGTAVFYSVEHWGIDNAEEWSSGALMRYRSRRVMMEMATDPVFEQFHDAKIAAMEKTIAFPTTTDVATGNLTVTVGLVLLSLALGMQLLINRQKGETHE